MSILSKTEDRPRPTPSAVYNARIYLCVITAALAAVMIGYDSAFIGGTLALHSFHAEFGLDKLSTSDYDLISANIVSCYQAGAFFGAFFAYPFGHFVGRKKGLMVFSGLFVVGCALMLVCTGATGLGLMYAGRTLVGMGVGGCSNLTPIYISEVAPPAIRGRLVGMFELGW